MQIGGNRKMIVYLKAEQEAATLLDIILVGLFAKQGNVHAYVREDKGIPAKT